MPPQQNKEQRVPTFSALSLSRACRIKRVAQKNRVVSCLSKPLSDLKFCTIFNNKREPLPRKKRVSMGNIDIL